MFRAFSRKNLERIKHVWGAGRIWGGSHVQHWLQHPLVQERINIKVSGTAQMNRFEYFLDRYLRGTMPVERALTLGSGVGELERGLCQYGFARFHEGLDLSDEAVRIASQKAESEGFRHIQYRTADLNTVTLDRRSYDAIFGVSSVHHIHNLEHLFQQVQQALKPGGYFFLDEFIGPSRFQWIHPEDPQRVYTLLNIPVTSHRNRSILFASVDGGQSWAPLKDISGNFVAASIAVDVMGKLTLTAIDGKTIALETPVFLDTSGAALDYVSLLSPAAGGVFPATSDRDMGNIAVLEDDGTLIYREFDLSGQSLEFQPRGDNTYSVFAVAPQLETDVGTSFGLFDEDARSVSLPFAFPFYSQSWQTMYVNSNGSVSFEKGDRSSSATVAAVFAGPPRIAPLWADLDPTAGGNVFLKAEAARMVITWKDIPLWHQTEPNTYQIVLFADGRIRFNYGTVDAKAGVTGISNGFQRDGNYVVFSGVGSNGLTGLRPLPIVQLFSSPTIDPVRVAWRFYESHGDDFDSLVYFAASDYPATLAGGAGAYFARVKNEVRGIGVSLGDFTPLFGSAGRLRGVINMNSLSGYPDAVTGPIPDSPASVSAVTILGQETTHRFGPFVRFRDAASASVALLGRQSAHWNYFLNSEASVMEGNEWSRKRGRHVYRNRHVQALQQARPIFDGSARTLGSPAAHADHESATTPVRHDRIVPLDI